jgi:single-strand DNA-binding protein
MPSLNKVMLMGNLTKDAELRYLPGGQAVLEFRLAVTRKFKNQAGEMKEETCFVDINLWGKRGEAVSQYLTKGKPIFVEGRLQLDEWDDKESGQRRSRMRVVAENIEFVGGGRGSDDGAESGGAPREQRASGGSGYGGGRPAPAREGYAGRPASAPAPTNGPAAAMQIHDDEIPF